MSHFYGTMSSSANTKALTKTGTKVSGMVASLATHDIKATTKILVDDNGDDAIQFFISSPEGNDDLIAEFTFKDNKLIRN